MGVDTNQAKSMAAPASTATSLGFVFDVEAWSVSIKPSTIAKTQEAIKTLLARGPTFRWPAGSLVRLLESLAGLLGFIEHVILSVVLSSVTFLTCYMVRGVKPTFRLGSTPAGSWRRRQGGYRSAIQPLYVLRRWSFATHLIIACTRMLREVWMLALGLGW